MEPKQFQSILIQELEASLDPEKWSVSLVEDTIQIKSKDQENAGFELSLPSILAKLETGKEQLILQETVYKVVEMAEASLQEKSLAGKTDSIFPVLRSNSFPTSTKQGVHFCRKEHTAESAIFYALDLGKSYVLINVQMAQEAGYSEHDIHQFAMANLKKLDTSYKEDVVAGNRFYFFAQKDGYAASRILNEELMAFMRRKVEKEMAVAIPHQDVLIIADIHNEVGYKALSRINMDFCMKGDIPISPLPFIYNDQQELEPIMIISNPGKAPNIVRKNKK